MNDNDGWIGDDNMSTSNSFYRRAIATLSQSALLRNLQVMQRLSSKSQVIAMVKANAYGHGIRSVSKRLGDHVYALGVASIDEAVCLRHCGVVSKIILMEGVVCQKDLDLVASLHLDMVVHDFTHLTWLSEFSGGVNDVWIKVDIGMGRLGFFPQDVPRVVGALKRLNIKGQLRLMGHLSSAEAGMDHLDNQQQLQQFSNVVCQYDYEASLCNSAATYLFPDHHYDYIRPGLALYGACPIQDQLDHGLTPVMTVKSRLIAVKYFPRGHGIGYGHDFVCSRSMRVGVISFGYGDGFPRSVRSGCPVLIDGIECPLIGRVSMDMMTVDLSACPQAQIGSEVVLWGDGLPIATIESHSGISRYELFTSVQNRVKFIWDDG